MCGVLPGGYADYFESPRVFDIATILSHMQLALVNAAYAMYPFMKLRYRYKWSRCRLKAYIAEFVRGFRPTERSRSIDCAARRSGIAHDLAHREQHTPGVYVSAGRIAPLDISREVFLGRQTPPAPVEREQDFVERGYGLP